MAASSATNLLTLVSAYFQAHWKTVVLGACLVFFVVASITTLIDHCRDRAAARHDAKKGEEKE